MLNGQTAAGLPRFSYVGARFCLWGLNVPFDGDGRFAKAWNRSISEVRDHFSAKTPEVLATDWKAYVCCWAGQQALQVEGDFVECGVNLGVLSRTVADFLDFAALPRTFWLYDTFRGIPPEQMSATEAAGLGAWHNRHNYTEDVFDRAAQRFARFPNARLVRGRVPDTLAEQAPERVAFLHIDMNIVQPEIAAAEFFWPRLSPGGVIILDDYGFAGHEEQMIAFQDFAADRDLLVLPLPTGQGLIIKP